MGNYAAAEKDLLAVIMFNRLDNNDIKFKAASNGLGIVYFKTERHEKAYERFREVYPTTYQGLKYYGELCLDHGEYKTSLNALDTYLEKVPNDDYFLSSRTNALTHLIIGNINDEQRKKYGETAIRDLNTIINIPLTESTYIENNNGKVRLGDWVFYDNMGLFYGCMDLPLKSYECYKKALDSKTKNNDNADLAYLYCQMGNQLNNAGKQQFAEKNIKEANKHFNSALEIIKKAILIDEYYTESYENQGIILYNLKRKAEACESWSKGMSLGDESSQHYYNKLCVH